MKGAARAGLKVAEDGVDPAKLRQVTGILPSDQVNLIASASGADGAEASKADQRASHKIGRAHV